MNYTITHRTSYTYSESVPVCHNLVHLEPRAFGDQGCSRYQLLVQPEPAQIYHRQDSFGNRVSYFSVDQAHRGLTVTAISDVEVGQRTIPEPREQVSWERVAADLAAERTTKSLEAYQFFFDSPRIRPIPQLARYARKSFEPGRDIIDALLAFTEQIHQDFRFDPRATTVSTPVEEVFLKRHGVCQDFAHLQIACLRSLGLAARYVSGYLRTEPPPGKPRLIGADASHAWVSLYCGIFGWVDVDPTNNCLASTDHVTVAWGRDYSDVCPIQGVIVGGGEHKLNVSVDVAPCD